MAKVIKPSFLDGLNFNLLNEEGKENIKFPDDIYLQIISNEDSISPTEDYTITTTLEYKDTNNVSVVKSFYEDISENTPIIDKQIQLNQYIKKDDIKGRILEISVQVLKKVSSLNFPASTAITVFERTIDYEDPSKETVTPPPPIPPVTKIQLVRPSIADPTDDVDLWSIILKRKVKFIEYNNFIDDILCNREATLSINRNEKTIRPQSKRLPFIGVEEYSIIKFATEAYMTTILDIEQSVDSFITNSGYFKNKTLPYFELIKEKLNDIKAELDDDNECGKRLNDNFENFSNVELIWSYWIEQGMLVQTMNAISLRFQNIKSPQLSDSLNRLDVDRIRPIGNIIWGYIQDEQHTLSLQRRVYEYDHEYGLILEGKAVPKVRSVDSRSKFLEAFHNLLFSCSVFFKEADDTTRVPDGFPILNNLREVHMLLAEGNHNAYGNLTWTARQEMMIQQYILARPEMREFLGGKIMVPYAEPWMDRVDTVRQMQGWGNTSITYYHDLASFGELIVLSIRLGNWSQVADRNSASNWAGTFRNEIQRYIHSYRTVTGVDLSADSSDNKEMFAVQPSMLIQRRVQNEKMLSMPRRNFARQAYY